MFRDLIILKMQRSYLMKKLNVALVVLGFDGAFASIRCTNSSGTALKHGSRGSMKNWAPILRQQGSVPMNLP